MTKQDIPFRPATMTPVIDGGVDERAAFLVKVYQHVALAILAFIGFEAALFVTGIAERMFDFFFGGGGFAWLLLLGGVSLISNFAARSANRLGDIKAQYTALFVMAAGQALLFAPFLYYVLVHQGATGDVVAAAIISLLGFAALTGVAFVTRRDLSFLRPIVMWGGIAAIGLIIAAVVFGFTLGPIFSVAMVALMGASILYQTQNIIRRYPEWAYVAAAVGLFSSLMTMFWYVLRLVNQMRR